MMRPPAGILLSFLLVAGCAGNVATETQSAIPDAGTMDSGIPAGYSPLVLLPFELPAGTDGYRCRRVELDSDLHINGFRSISPRGTHHVIATVSEPGAPVGDVDCTTGNVEPRVLHATGTSGGDMDFPAGTALHLRRGQRVLLSLHVVNATNDPLVATAGVVVRTLAPADVTTEAEMIFVGRTGYTVPAATDSFAVTGDCAVGADFRVFAGWPHMHRRGAWQKVTLTHQGATTDLFESLYTFDEQRAYALPDMAIHAGDAVRIECVYANLNAAPVSSGDGAGDEMCLFGMYRYPAIGSGAFDCVR